MKTSRKRRRSPKPKQRRGRREKKATRPEHTPAPVSTAIVPLQPQPLPVMVKRHGLTDTEVTLLKNTIACGTTDDEFALFLWVARKHKLDPMTRQLHCVKRWSSSLVMPDGKKGGFVMALQVGIDGYRTMAARGHRDYGGVDEPEFEFEQDTKTLKLARVRVWKKGFDHPTVGVAYWKEYAPDLAKPESFMWVKMPKGQLAKCAEALALRKAYPDLADIYTDEEMEQANDDNAPSGRQMTVGGTTSIEKKALTSPEYAAQFCAPGASASGGKEPPPESVGAAPQPRVAVNREPEPRAAPSPAPKPGKGKKVLVQWHSEDDNRVARVNGDIAALLPRIKNDCLGIWLETAKAWIVPSSHVHVLAEICETLGYEYIESSRGACALGASSDLPSPKKEPEAAGEPAPKADPTSSPRDEVKSAVGSPAVKLPTTEAPVAVVKGVIEKVNMGMTQSNTPMREVKIGKTWHKCFSQTLHEFLDGKHGKVVGIEVEVYIQGPYKNIVGFKRIGLREFDVDGKTPAIQVNEERSSGRLF